MVYGDVVDGKPTLGKKIILGGAIACAVVGGAYFYYRSQGSSNDGDGDEPPSSTSGETTTTTGSMAPVVSDVPVDAQGMKARGNKYFKGGRFEKAIECYTEAIGLCGDDDVADLSTFYQNRAAANEQLKQWSEVINDCTKAIELNPKYSKALHRRAKAYEALDNKRSCLEDVTAVCLLEGFQNQQCMILADRVLKGIGKELAAEHFKIRPRVLPSSTSIKSYLDSFHNDVFDVPTEELVGEQIYSDILTDMRNKNYDNIEQMCGEVEKSGSKHTLRAILLRATILTLMNDNERAMLDLDRIIGDGGLVDDIVPLQVDALIKRGSLRMQQADDVGCYGDLARAIELDETNASIYHSRGQLYFLTERLNEAKVDFEKAIGLESGFVAPRIQLGYCLCKMAMQVMSPQIMGEANQVLEETTRLFPDSTDAWSLYGQLLQDQQRLDEAAAKLDKAISLAPELPTTYVYKALLLLQWKQDVTEANKLIRKAIELDEKCDFAYETLATLEVQKGNNEEAIALFQRSLELVRTEAEMANTYSLLEAAKAQSKVTKQYGITLPQNPQAFA